MVWATEESGAAKGGQGRERRGERPRAKAGGRTRDRKGARAGAGGGTSETEKADGEYEAGVGSLTSVWPGLGWSCVAWLWDRGCGLDRQPHLPGSLCYSPGAELDSPVFLLSTSPQKASLYSMDNRDPRKFFMSGERKWVMTKGLGRCPGGTDLVSPSPRLHWLCAPCSLPLRFQLSCAQQPGTAGIWTDEVRGQIPEGS